jgi:hypothetical protein
MKKKNVNCCIALFTRLLSLEPYNCNIFTKTTIILNYHFLIGRGRKKLQILKQL